MFKIFIFFLLIITSNIYSKDHKHDLCVCAIFHNEARFLDEWIEHYVQEGVDRIYLYNNKSNDDYMRVLYKYIRAGIVVLRQWPYENDLINWSNTQCSCYMHCVEKIKEKYKWCAFVDTDEFLFSPTSNKLIEMLKKYDYADGIGVNWVAYGTSNIESLGSPAKCVQNLLYRQEIPEKQEGILKSIVKPEKIVSCPNPHFFILKEGSIYINEENLPITSHLCPFSANIFRINHYWTRDKKFLYNEKYHRQNKWFKIEKEELKRRDDLFNKVYDPILLLRKIL